ncbi:MAG TPA: hypothetical protein PKX48_05920 [Planctomycetota bacterium]|jgi:tetratricopeptide (TPR) repeat protein|nr:hypothetical protein [Planctomycetota bacterium]OQC19974.1 MAG: hypothetical protein BWX69_02250 [Planctomycetes bacterium ADurb.Bin069]HNR99520.1 hypothetical protein [Planctomycetota bacterium]HNU26571.1 hypothetical protein [Planctomycetota bacterium]HOE30478.1 hypothetical protein [Planctomycetota bacterium]
MTLGILGLAALLAAAADTPADRFRRARYADLIAETAADPAARNLRARALAMTGRHAEALAALPEGGEADLIRGEILRATGRLAEAEALLAGLPPSPESCCLRGEILAHRGAAAEARESFEAALLFYERMTGEEALGAPPDLFVLFGRALVGLNRFEEANEVMLAQALEQGRERPDVLLFGAGLFASKYDFPEARKYLRRALAIAPGHPDALAALGRTYLDDPTAGGLRLPEAGRLIAQALEVNPRHEQALIARGDLEFFDGLLEPAMARYRAALAVNPASLEALGALYVTAHLWFRFEAMREAEAAARAVSRAPAPFYLAAARRCEVQNQYPLGLASARAAHRLDASYWPLYTTLALGELRAGNYGRAADAVKEGFALDPYNIWLNNTRALLAHLDRAYAAEAWGDIIFHAPADTLPFYVNYLGPLLAGAAELFRDRYGAAPPVPVHVEIYPRQEHFSCRVLGLPDFPAQGVCFGPVIAVTVAPAYSGNHALSVWHEFAHVFTVAGTDYRVPRWLTEGISVREEGLCPVGGARSNFRALGTAVARGDIPSLADFDRRFRRPRSPAELLNAYALSPLAVELLIERHGHGVLQRILRGLRVKEFPAAFQEAAGVALEAFDGEWRAFVAAAGKDAALEFAGECDDIEALKARARARDAEPRDLADYAWALLAAGNDVDAESLALALKERNALPGDAAALLGFVHRARGEDAAAARAFEAALAGGTRNAFRVLLERAQMGRSAKDEAGFARELTAIWKRFPALAAEAGDHGPLGTLCRLLARDKAPELKAALLDLTALSADSAWAREALADLFIAEGEPARAFALLSQAVFIAPFTAPGKLNTELFDKLIACAERLDLQVEVARAKKVRAACK